MMLLTAKTTNDEGDEAHTGEEGEREEGLLSRDYLGLSVDNAAATSESENGENGGDNYL